MRNQIKILPIIFLLFLSGCLKDAIVPPLNIQLESAAEILQYMEENGDYIYSDEIPSLVEVEEVYNNLNSYLIIDVRSESDFNAGHIQEAINIQPKNLLIISDSLMQSSYQKLIIISAAGQAAGFYASLLRISGNDKVYSMNFGMGYWNKDFSKVWLDEISSDNGRASDFIEEDGTRNSFNNLPNITFSRQDLSIKEKLKDRIQTLLNEGFDETSSVSSTSIKIDFITYPNNFYLAYYSDEILYKSKKNGIGHPAGAVYYSFDPAFRDLRSVRYLQTLPADKPIILFTYNGQLGAYVTAYLRILGYNAQTLLFGANSFYHQLFINIADKAHYFFQESKIKNYSFVLN